MVTEAGADLQIDPKELNLNSFIQVLCQYCPSVTHDKAIKIYQALQAHIPLEELVSNRLPQFTFPQPETVVERRLLKEELISVFSELLPGKELQALWLYAWGLTNNEIGKCLSCAPQYASRLRHMAVLRLRVGAAFQVPELAGLQQFWTQTPPQNDE